MKKNLWKLTTGAVMIAALAGCSVHANTAATNDATQTKEITVDQAKEIAFAHAAVNESEISDLRVKNDREDGRSVIEVDFNANGYEYDYDVSATDGTLIKSEREPLKATTPGGTSKNDASTQTTTKQNKNAANTNTNDTNTASSATITKEQAQNIALQDAGVRASDAQIIRVKEDYEHGQAVYEIEFYSGNTEYDYEIAKSDGSILSKDFDIENWEPSGNGSSNAQTSITLEEAKAIALAKVSGAGNDHIWIEKDMDDGRITYEGEIYYQGMEYEFEINASTGAVIEWSSERADWD